MAVSERDVMDIITARLKREADDQFWLRIYSMGADSIHFAGRLSEAEIRDYVRALWFAREFKQNWLESLVHDAIAMSASKRGKGREEAVRAKTGSPEDKLRDLLRVRRER